jgi:hypothetical protein
MNIENYVNNLINRNTPFTHDQNELGEIKKVLDNAHVSVSFWKGRRIQVPGYTGEVTLDKVASKVNNFLLFRNTDHSLLSQCQAIRRGNSGRILVYFTNEERLTGLEISEKLGQLYQNTDGLINQWNFFKRTLYKIKEYLSYKCSDVSLTYRQVEYPSFRSLIDARKFDEMFRSYGPDDFLIHTFTTNIHPKANIQPESEYQDENGKQIKILPRTSIQYLFDNNITPLRHVVTRIR